MKTKAWAIVNKNGNHMLTNMRLLIFWRQSTAQHEIALRPELYRNCSVVKIEIRELRPKKLPKRILICGNCKRRFDVNAGECKCRELRPKKKAKVRK